MNAVKNPPGPADGTVLYLATPDCPGLSGSAAETDVTIRRPSTTEKLLERLDAARQQVGCVVAAHDPPSVDGLSVLSAVREVDPTVPFVLCSTVRDPRVGSDALDGGVDQYVPAPAYEEPAAALADAVEAALSERRSAGLNPLAIFDSVGEGIVIHETDTDEILDCNERYCEMLGYDRDELLDMKVSDVSATDHPGVGDPSEKIERAATEGPQVFEWVDLTKSGEELPVEVCLTRTEIGGTDYVIAAVRDISDRKRTEEMLRERNERLERFASVVSHDLRNPLFAAMAKRRLAAEDCCPDCQHLDELADIHERMETIIDDVLSLAESRTSSVETEPVDLRSVVLDVWEYIDTEDLTLRLDELGRIEADSDRLERAVENLLSNAVEHADCGPKVGMLEDGFYIADDGPGIPPEERDEIFEYGYTTTDGGSGFGLNIVRRVAEMHGWRVTVTRSETGGARFEIRNVSVLSD